MSSTNIVIASVARTPVTSFLGSLSGHKASELGSIAIKGALAKLPEDLAISEAILGNVVSAGMGQAPARQAVIGAGLPESTICTTINKVCASGMKSVMMASQSLMCNPNTGGAAMLAGGMESMSNIPRYVVNSREGTRLGHTTVLDGVIHDGLWDVYSNQPMGMCAEKCATDYSISREEQDMYTIESYKRAQAAIEAGFFEEIVPVTVTLPRNETKVVEQDEGPFSVDLEKVPTLAPAFDPESGTVTAANASNLNDGACALVVMKEEDAIDRGVVPLARVRGFGDAEQASVDFTTSPSLAVPVALKNAGMEMSDVEYHEINEAFAAVALANMRLLKLDPSRVNVFGGAVALGHPVGMSGARLIGTLYDVLKKNDATVGCASICNGGGGASAIVLERLN